MKNNILRMSQLGFISNMVTSSSLSFRWLQLPAQFAAPQVSHVKLEDFLCFTSDMWAMSHSVSWPLWFMVFLCSVCMTHAASDLQETCFFFNDLRGACLQCMLYQSTCTLFSYYLEVNLRTPFTSLTQYEGLYRFTYATPFPVLAKELAISQRSSMVV